MNVPGFMAVPPSDLPLVKATPHPSPDTWNLVVGRSAGQLRDWPDPLTVWCLTRQRDYDLAHPFWSLALCAYATARDLICFQLATEEHLAIAELQRRVLVL